MKFSYDHARPGVAVDCVVFGFDPKDDVVSPLKVLLVCRGKEPFRGQWALPGGFVHVSDDGDQGEDLEAAARRELREETGIEVDYLEQLYTFGAPHRDPRTRVISVAYFALVRSRAHVAHAGSDASEAAWLPVRAFTSEPLMAFDHQHILLTAYDRLRAKVRYAPLGFNLLPASFTLSELRVLYETLLGRKLDPSNFRKKMLATGVLSETGSSRGGQHRPAPLYRFNKRAYDKAVREGFNFEV